MIDSSVDDQGRITGVGFAAGEGCQRIAHSGVPDFDPVAALGREPAAIKTLRGYDEPFVLVCGPLQVAVDGLLGNAADYARRYQHDDGGDDEKNHDALFHGSVPGWLIARRC